MSNLQLTDSVILVTGAGDGLGRTIAKVLAEAGAKVAVSDINPEAAEKVAGEINDKYRHDSIAITADVSNVDQVNMMINQVISHYGRLDGLVNNAGVSKKIDIMDITEKDWDWMDKVNSKGVFFCVQRAADQMIKQGGGRIVNIASIGGRGFSGTSNAAYAATKGAVIALTKIAALKLATHNITVNAVCPGLTRSVLFDKLISEQMQVTGLTREEVEADRTQEIPLGRVNEPEDVAYTVRHLLSDGARNITGQSINVDGGVITS